MEEMSISKLYSVSEIPHSHKIKAPIFKIVTWSTEEVVLLNKVLHSLPLPHVQLGKIFRSKKRIAVNLLENKGNKNPLHHMENKILYSCFMRRKNHTGQRYPGCLYLVGGDILSNSERLKSYKKCILPISV